MTTFNKAYLPQQTKNLKKKKFKCQQMLAAQVAQAQTNIDIYL